AARPRPRSSRSRRSSREPSGRNPEVAASSRVGPAGADGRVPILDSMADLISFARGAPSADILPVDAVREAAARALEEDWERALSYGKGAGHRGLVEWIADRHSISPDQVMV